MYIVQQIGMDSEHILIKSICAVPVSHPTMYFNRHLLYLYHVLYIYRTVLSALKVAPLFKTQGRKFKIFYIFVCTQVAPLNKTQDLEYF